MDIDGYPALYRSADAASLRAQLTHFWLLRLNGIALVVAAGASLFSRENATCGWVAALFFVISTVVSIVMLVKRYDIDWYKTRALAESVKTTTWRYMMGVDPFPINMSLIDADRLFAIRLAEILADNRQVAGGLIDSASEGQITRRMREVRQLPCVERRSIYQSERIGEQQVWYGRKAAANSRWARRFFVLLIVFQLLAAGSSLGSVLVWEWKIWPTDLLALVASLILGWTQAKRFSELSASYALAAHEIGFINSRIDGVFTDDELAQFVLEAEGAFSREHTQWVAQRS